MVCCHIKTSQVYQRMLHSSQGFFLLVWTPRVRTDGIENQEAIKPRSPKRSRNAGKVAFFFKRLEWPVLEGLKMGAFIEVRPRSGHKGAVLINVDEIRLVETLESSHLWESTQQYISGHKPRRLPSMFTKAMRLSRD
jgi:hypothetical protein